MKKSMRRVKMTFSLFLSIVLILMSYKTYALGAADREQIKSGYIFLPEDFNAAAINRNDGMYAYRSAAEEKYITENLPTVRDQGRYGCCWAFSSIALAEISVLKHENMSLDLSELHLAYFTYDGTADALGGLTDNNQFISTTSNFLDKGGNYSLAAHALANWKGAADESTVPYESAEAVIKNGIDDGIAYNSVAHLRNAYTININENPEEVKKMIKEYGAVGITYYHDYKDMNYTHNSYYSSDFYGYGHAVSVVGWDDTFPKENFNIEAPGDGAWLIRNSWGYNGYSLYGYFWMSYYEATIINTAYVFDFVSSKSDEYYDNNYQYDGTIASNTYEISSGGKLANVFTTQNDFEELKAVSFEVESTNVNYEVNIYKNVEDGNPESGILVSTTAGSTIYAGIHNVKLTTPVQLVKGDKYSVVITLKTSTGNVKYAVDSKIKYEDWFSSVAVAEPGQSYYRYPMAKWNDFGTISGCNIRIKAFTDTVAAPEEEKDISEAEITIGEAVYAGEQQRPWVEVVYDGSVLTADDYTVEYYDNINAGSAAYVIVTGKGNYTGEVRKNFSIAQRNINAREITVSEPGGVTYTGNAFMPEVTVEDNGTKLIKNTDYTVEYKNNINVGTAIVTISGKGNYSGNRQVSFKINAVPLPAMVTSSVVSVNQQTLMISKVTAGYRAENLLEVINERKYCVVKKGNQDVSGGTVLGTGMRLNLMDNSIIIKSYSVVVTGDVNGDGKINITDMIAVKQDILGKYNLAGEYKEAGDVNGDGKINITDFIKIKASILGRDEI